MALREPVLKRGGCCIGHELLGMRMGHVHPIQMSKLGAPRRPTNVTLPENLVHEARALGINVSQACERGLLAEVGAAMARRWQEDNRAAIDAWNGHVDRHGIPLAEFRSF